MPPKQTTAAADAATAGSPSPGAESASVPALLESIMAQLTQMNQRIGELEHSGNKATVTETDDPFGPATVAAAPAGQQTRTSALVQQPTLARIDEAGPRPGPQGLTPAQGIAHARGASGMLVPITPQHGTAVKISDSATRAIDRTALHVSVLMQPEAYQNFRRRLFPAYFRNAESQTPHASDEQLVNSVEKQLAIDWEEQQRGLAASNSLAPIVERFHRG
ncbi:hypothetical protein V8E36_002215 [Tilletia maclaganii]